MKTCLNCDAPLSGEYCVNCGQKASTRRITWKSFLEELPRSIFNLEEGFWYSAKELSLRTRSALDGYLAGKRVNLFKPIQYAILGITLYTLIQEFHPSNAGQVRMDEQVNEVYNLGYAVGKLIRGNLKFFWLLGVFLFALPARLFFGKYNFAEHMVVSAYIMGHSSLLASLSLLTHSWPIMLNPIIYLLMGILYFRLFKDPVNPLGTVGMVILHLLTCILLFFLIPILIYYGSRLF